MRHFKVYQDLLILFFFLQLFLPFRYSFFYSVLTVDSQDQKEKVFQSSELKRLLVLFQQCPYSDNVIVKCQTFWMRLLV